MSDRDALLRAILINPAEDTPRLMYADYIEEYGGSTGAQHAELIRLQIKIAGYGYKPRTHFNREIPAMYCVKCKALHANLFASTERLVSSITDECDLCYIHRTFWFTKSPLLAEHIADFRREREMLDLLSGVRVVSEVKGYKLLRRGFVSGIRLSEEEFLRDAEMLFSLHPIETVTITDIHPDHYLGTEEEGYSDEFWYWRDCEFIERLSSKYPSLRWESLSEWSANEWLSRACVSYGRELAGLPPLYDERLRPLPTVNEVTV
jgi:uncharacterized protein (TIGR02996 family)